VQEHVAAGVQAEVGPRNSGINGVQAETQGVQYDEVED